MFGADGPVELAPFDADALADALERLLDDERRVGAALARGLRVRRGAHLGRRRRRRSSASCATRCARASRLPRDPPPARPVRARCAARGQRRCWRRWACVMPAFQAPDEQSHFAYVQSLGARHALPGDTERPAFSTADAAGHRAVNSDQVAAQRQVKPEWSDRSSGAGWRPQGRAARDDGGGPQPGVQLSADRLRVGGDRVRGRLGGDGVRPAARRAADVGAVDAGHRARHLAARGRGLRPPARLQTAAAAVPALLPMFTFISASVSPDGMMYALWTLALWLGVRCVRRGVPLADGAAFFAVVGLACTVKTTSYALLPAALFVAVLGVAGAAPVADRRPPAPGGGDRRPAGADARRLGRRRARR